MAESSRHRRVRRRTTSGDVTAKVPTDAALEPLIKKIKLNLEPLGLSFDDASFSDVTLVLDATGTQRRCFRCHRVILASFSTYFSSLFTADMQESTQSEIVLKGTDHDLCESVLRLLYGQEQDITPENLFSFLHLADFYGVPELLSQTEALLESFVTLDSQNCCAKLCEAAALRCTKAQDHCKRIILLDFCAAMLQPAFASLELDVVADLLASDELVIKSEETALEGLTTWLAAQRDKALPPDALDRLLALIRWPLLSMESLSAVEQRYPELAASPSLPRLLLEGFCHHSAGDAGGSKRQSCRMRRGMVQLAALIQDVLPAGPSVGDVNTNIPSRSFAVWNIPHFCALPCHSMYSPYFWAIGHRWRILIFPRGSDDSASSQHMSLFLDSSSVPAHSGLQCTYGLSVINYRLCAEAHQDDEFNPDESFNRAGMHTFSGRSNDLGWHDFMPLTLLKDLSAGFLNERTITITAMLRVM